MKEKGFSLIELIIVMLIIGIIATIAIPSLIAARISANNAAGLSVTRTLSSSQATYRITKGDGNFGTLAELGNEGIIDSVLASGTRGGYNFTVTKFDGTTAIPANYNAFATAIAFGTGGASTGSRNFYTNESGVIYENSAGQDNPPNAVSNVDRTIVNGTSLDR